MKNQQSDQKNKDFESIEAIRKRLGMYVGSTSPRGLHRLIYEIVDNSINEVLRDYCTQVEVELNADGSVTVTDDGRGIPTDIQPETNKSVLETAMTRLQLRFSGKQDSKNYKVDGALRGLGLPVVNALSEWVDIKVWHSGNVYTQRYERGYAVTELQVRSGQENYSGTSFTFKPDPQIFKVTEFDCIRIATHLRQLAYLNPGLKITLRDRRQQQVSKPPQVSVYHYPNGIREYIAEINRDQQPLHDIIHIRGERDNVQVEVAWQWSTTKELENLRRSVPHTLFAKEYLNSSRELELHTYTCILSFANQVCTVDGGTHVAGVKTGLLQALEAIACKQGQLPENNFLSWKDLRNGLTCIVSVMLFNPEHRGPMKGELDNAEVEEIVESLVAEAFAEYLEASPSVTEAILDRVRTDW